MPPPPVAAPSLGGAIAARKSGSRHCLALFAVALALRIGTVVYINRAYSTFVFAPDSQLYDGLAKSLVAGEGYAIDGDHREYTRIAPVFPIYLAVLYGLLGSGVQMVGLANAVVGSLTCLVVYGIGRKLLSRWAPVLGGLLATAYWEFLFWTPFVLKETLALFMFSGALLLILESMERRSRQVAFLGGCALGRAGLARYPHLLFFPFLVAMPLAILGAGGHARVVIDIVERMGSHRIVGVFDDDPAKRGTQVFGYDVLGGIEEFLLDCRSRCPEAVIGIGDNRARRSLI